METMVYIKRDNQQPVPVRLRTLRQNGQWLAVAEIQTKSGPVRLTAMASEKTVSDLVQRGKISMVAGADFFSMITKFAQSQAAQNVLKQAQNVVKNPMFMTALSFIPGVGPALATVNKASDAVKAAENLMGRARQGDGKAQSSISVIASAAKKGSKKGTLLLALLQAADGVRKTFFSGDAVEVNDLAAQSGAYSPPWDASTGNSWTPPWSAPNQSTSSAQLPGGRPNQAGPRWPMAPFQGPNPNMPPQGSPGQPHYPWPWFPRTNFKC